MADDVTPERHRFTVSNTCPECHKPSYVEVWLDEYQEWVNDIINNGPKRHIQVAMPELPPDKREILITGMHPECWDAMFGEDEE